MLLVDANGNVVCRYEYNAYGGDHLVYDADNLINNKTLFIGNINPIRYKSYYYDVETGLYWVSLRYYNKTNELVWSGIDG